MDSVLRTALTGGSLRMIMEMGSPAAATTYGRTLQKNAHTDLPLPVSTLRAKARWLAGAARSGAACLAAIAFCAATAAAGPNPGPPGPTVEVGKAALAMSVAQNMALLGGASFAAGETLRATLANYPGLPPARIALVRARTDPKGGLSAGSTSVQDHRTGRCEIALVVDPDGAGSIVSAVKSTMGFTPGPALAMRLGALEALHELGHCSAHARGSPFDHPALSPAENKALGDAIKDTPLGAIWGESYADSYALLQSFARAAPGSPEQVIAAGDAAILEGWRKMERDSHAHPSARGMKIDHKLDEHITEKSIEELLARPGHWLDDSTSIESRAAQLASIGMLRAHKATDQPERLAQLSLTLDGKIEVVMARLVKSIATVSIIAVSLTPESPGAEPGSKWFEDAMSKMVFEALPARPELPMVLAATQTPALARLAYEAATLQRAHLAKGAPELDAKGIVDFQDGLMAEALAQGLVKAALAKAPAGQPLLDAPAARAWAKAERAEANSPDTVASAKEDNRLAAVRLSQAGQATIDTGFQAEKASLNIGDWREHREASPSRPPPAPPALLP